MRSQSRCNREERGGPPDSGSKDAAVEIPFFGNLVNRLLSDLFEMQGSSRRCCQPGRGGDKRRKDPESTATQTITI